MARSSRAVATPDLRAKARRVRQEIPGPQGQSTGEPRTAGSEQSATQGNGIGQVAGAAAKSTQVAPTNVNVAPSILSVGSSDGGVTQGNASSANANAQNENKSFQVNGAGQQGGGNPGPQGQGPRSPGHPWAQPRGQIRVRTQETQPSQSATQGNGIGQVAGAAAKSTQVAPTNVNVAPSILSVGSNDGGVTQGNASSANANAQNSSSSGQGNILGQGTGGPSGLLD